MDSDGVVDNYYWNTYDSYGRSSPGIGYDNDACYVGPGGGVGYGGYDVYWDSCGRIRLSGRLLQRLCVPCIQRRQRQQQLCVLEFLQALRTSMTSILRFMYFLTVISAVTTVGISAIPTEIYLISSKRKTLRGISFLSW